MNMAINKLLAAGLLFIVLTLGFIIFIFSYRPMVLNNKDIQKPVMTFFNLQNIFLGYTKENENRLNTLDQVKADALIHRKLIQTFKGIFIGELLARYCADIEYCSWFSEDYSMFFRGFDNLKIEKVKTKRIGADKAICKAIYRCEERSNLTEYENLDIQNLVQKYKITNFTQAQLNKAKYSDYIIYSENQDEFHLKQIKNKWFIYEFNNSILNSKLKLIEPHK
jgi:hypothetical protein